MTREARLGIDFGTSSTVAVLETPGGQTMQLIFDGTPMLTSSVCLDESGVLLAGRDAVHAARVRPEFFEPSPKLCIDDGEVLLHDRVVSVPALIGAVLGRVYGEARRVLASAPATTVLTYPIGWGSHRLEVLKQAAELAGLPRPQFVAEPVAAAAHFIATIGNEMSAGQCVVVYDFGAGTFDASVVRCAPGTFEVLAKDGLRDAGGRDVDAAVLAYFGAVYGTTQPDQWERITNPGSPGDRRAAIILWDDVRNGKELLSRTASTTMLLPHLEIEGLLTRDKLERLAQPVLERTVQATRSVIRAAGIGHDDIAGLYLVGGASRMPLAATMLLRSLGIAPTVVEQPELIVAAGSLKAPPTQVSGPTAPSTASRSRQPTTPIHIRSWTAHRDPPTSSSAEARPPDAPRPAPAPTEHHDNADLFDTGRDAPREQPSDVVAAATDGATSRDVDTTVRQSRQQSVDSRSDDPNTPTKPHVNPWSSARQPEGSRRQLPGIDPAGSPANSRNAWQQVVLHLTILLSTVPWLITSTALVRTETRPQWSIAFMAVGALGLVGYTIGAHSRQRRSTLYGVSMMAPVFCLPGYLIAAFRTVGLTHYQTGLLYVGCLAAGILLVVQAGSLSGSLPASDAAASDN
ncbi:Hsp70 family protein [Dactylosporangium sp. NPDC049742]|uniref:Hsp70 family protein n=1 Tax=Dactylosporangium sp. NPDC049742 TaxID=3154737 RepID=UPI003426060C